MKDNYNLVTPEIVEYIETKILPRYDEANGHGVGHIRNVIRRSLDFARRINDGEIKTTAKDFANLPSALANGKVSYDMVFVVAAFHDLGRLKNDKLHHLISAAWLLDDDFLEGHFSRDELRVMADAVMDHRASNELEPLTIYGRIVSSGDRDTDPEKILRRAYAHFQHNHPDETEAEVRERVFQKVWRKFAAPDAYAPKKMFFKNPEYDKMVARFREISKDRETFDAALDKALKN